ncbi:hypothetical protein MY3957_008230 [Beauveria namnaoensis]
MLFFQPVFALLGFAVLAAGYSIPGSYERLYFYYAYRMDHLTSDKPIIAPGCKPSNGKICDLKDFLKFISQDNSKIESSIAAITHPEVQATAKDIADKGLTGIIKVNKVVHNAKGDYANLFEKVGQRFVGKLADESPSKLTGEALKDFQDCRMKGYEALHSVFRERMRAAVDSFKPFGEEATPFVVKSRLQGDVPCFHLADTVAANPHVSKAKIKEAWLAHTAGGHRENLSVLAKDNKAAETILNIAPCKPGGNGRRAASQAALCAIGSLDDDALFPKRAKLGNSAKLAEEVSDVEFERLASKKGYKRIANDKWRGTTLPEVRTKLKYEKLTPESPKVNLGKGGGFRAPSIGPLDVGIWVFSVVRAWALDVTDLDRAAAVTSILPIVGCVVQGIADGEKGIFDALDTGLCILGDELLFTAAAPIGIAVHVLRAILSFFRPPPIPELKDMQKSRDAIWNRFLKDDVYSYIYSHPSYYNATGRRKNDTDAFREKLESAFTIEGLAVLSHGAQTIGAAVGSAQDSLHDASTTPEDRAKIQQGIEDVTAQLEAAADKEITRRQRELLISLPHSLKEKHNVLLGPVADKFNDEFINQATSEEMIRKYYKVTASNGRTFTYVKDNGDEIRAKFKAIREGLDATPPALLKYFDVAYILGQSQGVAPLSDKTLSVQDYLRDTLTNMSEASIQLYTLHHTTQVAKLLLGELAEDQLSTKLPNSDAQGARDLQTLIAVKFGRVADASKVWLAQQQYPQGHWSLMLTPEDERNARIIVNPDVPPKIPNLAGPTSLFLASGLSQAIVTSLTDQERALSARGLAEGSQAIAEQARKLGELVSNHKSLWSSLVEAQKRKDATDAELLADPRTANASNDKVTKRLLLPRSASACHAQFAAAML